MVIRHSVSTGPETRRHSSNRAAGTANSITSLIAAARNAAQSWPNPNDIFGVVPATPIFVVQGDDPTDVIVPNYFGISHPSSRASSASPSPSPSTPRPTPPVPAAAWITAAYLLVHVIHELNWGTSVVEPCLVAWLLDSPPLSPPPPPPPPQSESWMQFWLWRTVIGAYVLLGGAAISPPDASGPDCGGGGSSSSSGIAEVQAWFDPLVKRWMERSATEGLAQWDVAQELVAKLAGLGTAGTGKRFLVETWREATRLRASEREAARMASREQAAAPGECPDGLQSFVMGPGPDGDALPAPVVMDAGGDMAGGHGDTQGPW